MPAEVEDHNDSQNKLKIPKSSVEDLDKDDEDDADDSSDNASDVIHLHPPTWWSGWSPIYRRPRPAAPRPTHRPPRPPLSPRPHHHHYHHHHYHHHHYQLCLEVACSHLLLLMQPRVVVRARR